MNRMDFRRPMGVLSPTDSAPLDPRFAAILREREADHRRVLLEHEQRYGHVVVAFSGPASFGLVTQVAAELEAGGMRVYSHWHRDPSGTIDGIDIVEVDAGGGR